MTSHDKPSKAALRNRQKAEAACRLADRLAQLLAGKSPDVAGAALCELLAAFIAGHQPAGDRESLLQMHISQVRKMVPTFAAKIHGRMQ